MSFRKQIDYHPSSGYDTGNIDSIFGHGVTVTGGRDTHSVVRNPSNGRIWILRALGDSISTGGDIVRDDDGDRKIIRLSNAPNFAYLVDLVFTNNSAGIFVAGYLDDGTGGLVPNVFVINQSTDAITAKINGFGAVGDLVSGITYDAPNQAVWVGLRNNATGHGQLIRFSTATFLQTHVVDLGVAEMPQSVVFGLNKVWVTTQNISNTHIVRVDPVSKTVDIGFPALLQSNAQPFNMFFSGNSGLFVTLRDTSAHGKLLRLNQTTGASITSLDLNPADTTASYAGAMVEIDANICCCGSPVTVPSLWVYMLDSDNQKAFLQQIQGADGNEGPPSKGTGTVIMPDTSFPTRMAQGAIFGECCCCCCCCCVINPDEIGTILVPLNNRDQILNVTVNLFGAFQSSILDYASLVAFSGYDYVPVKEMSIVSGLQSTTSTSAVVVAARSFETYNLTNGARCRFIVCFKALSGVNTVNVRLRNFADGDIVATFSTNSTSFVEHTKTLAIDAGTGSIRNGKMYTLEIFRNSGTSETCQVLNAKLVVDYV